MIFTESPCLSCHPLCGEALLVRVEVRFFAAVLPQQDGKARAARSAWWREGGSSILEESSAVPSNLARRYACHDASIPAD